METSAQEKQNQDKKKGFWGRLFDKIDKALKDKSDKAACCAPKDKDKKPGKSCCN